MVNVRCCGAWRLRSAALLLGSVALLLSACGGRTEAPETPAYDLQVELEPELRRMEGTAKLTFPAPDSGLGVLEFGLHRDLRIHYVKGELVAAFQQDTGAASPMPYAPHARPVYVVFNRTPEPGTPVEVTFRYSGRLEAIPPIVASRLDSSWVELNLYLPFYPMQRGIESFTWSARVALPEGWELAGPAPVRREDGRWELGPVGPTNDIVLAASPTPFRDRARRLDGMELRLRSLSLADSVADTLLADLEAGLAPMVERFGPPDPPRLTLLESPRRRGGGYARPGLVVLAGLEGDQVLGNRAGYLRYLAHEAAHLWFRRAPVESWEDWLNESTAEYWALRAVEERFGPERRERYEGSKRERVAEGEAPPIRGFDRSDRSTSRARQASEVNLYHKGPLLLLELEERVGRAALDSLLAGLLRAERVRTDTLLHRLRGRAPAAAAWLDRELRER